MLNNKILLLVSVIAVASVIAIFVFFGGKKKDLSPVINAIPTKASLILETDDFSYLSSKVLKNKDLISLLAKLELTNEFSRNLLILDSLIKKNKTFKMFLNEKTVVISAHLLGENNVDFLFATSFSERNNFINKFNEAILKVDDNIVTKQISFDGAEIINQKFKQNKLDIFYTFYEDYFLLSYSEILLQKSIKNINSGASYILNSNFKTLYKNTSKSNDATLYINYEDFFKSLKGTFNGGFKNKQILLQKFADWSAFNIILKRKEIKLVGHTILKPEMQYLSIFKDINPKKSKVLKLLPAKTSSFVSLNIGSGSGFKFKYEDYLGIIRMLNNHRIKLAAFYKKYKIVEDENSLYELTDNEIALVYEDFNKNGKKHNIFAFIEYKNKSDAINFFNRIVDYQNNNKNISFNNPKNTYISDGKEYVIYKLHEKKIPEIFYGILFENLNAEWLTFINGFVIFAESKQALKSLIDTYEEDKTFKRKSLNYSFINNLSSQSNIFFYLDLFHSKNVIEQILNEKSAKEFKEDAEILETIQGPAIQFISDGYPIYTTVDFAINSKKQQISETVWEVRLDTLIMSKPFVVVNHNTLEKEIVIQDVANKIYLIDKNGKILWTRQLDGKIISTIYQIDYYKNEKLQLFFNTKNKIYCIDRIGNWMEGYPVKLKSQATNGLSVFDYDNNRDYRIFVATKNRKVYLYNKEGNIIEGWKFNKTKSIVIKEIRFFKNNDKDYIVFRDKTELYILNRKGEIRVKPEADILLSKNTDIYFSKGNNYTKTHFSVSNPAGAIYSIFENGSISKTNIKVFSNNHFYIHEDIDNDNIYDYVFTDKNQTVAYSGKDNKRIYTYSYDEDIISDLTQYNFSDDDIRFGTGAKGKIYLINKKGRLCKGFPLVGTGFFSVAIFDDSNEFSLIVGNKDNYLYKYKIK